MGRRVPIGKVKWFDAEKGFGFASNPGDEDVYVGRSVLPEGVEELVPGQRIEFDFAAGRRGPQALRVKVLETPRRKHAHARKPVELASMLSDVMTLLETQVQPVLNKGRYPDRKTGRQVAEILRAIARDLDS
ncbi:cold-shock protein [Corynebacterium flavescens]|uniref:Cold-shock protein n=1 Tax=Corynebacterium flavescens TaxID=28028 RepID=A0AB73B874_CORFL|nr:cold-shock protein [Corynebacterium flavescens]